MLFRSPHPSLQRELRESVAYGAFNRLFWALEPPWHAQQLKLTIRCARSRLSLSLGSLPRLSKSTSSCRARECLAKRERHLLGSVCWSNLSPPGITCRRCSPVAPYSACATSSGGTLGGDARRTERQSRSATFFRRKTGEALQMRRKTESRK